MTFNLTEGARLRDEGLAKTNCWPWETAIGRARNCALLLAVRHGTVTADEIRDYMENSPDGDTRIAVQSIPPQAWGNVVRHPKLKPTGQYRKSSRKERHANPNQVWLYDANGK